MRKSNPIISIIDVLITLFVLSTICSLYFNNSNYINSYLTLFVPCYSIIRLLNNKISAFTELIVLLISVICLFECGYALLQLIYSFWGESSISFCGTFRNSGPFGGFLSVCICTLYPYVRKCKNNFVKNIATISLTAAVIILPGSYSRAAILSCVICCFLFAIKYEERFRIFIFEHKLPVTLVLIVLSFGAYKYKQGSADGRIFIDKISVQMLFPNHFFGVGIGNYAGKYGEAQCKYFREKLSSTMEYSSIHRIEHERMIADCPDLAFNDYLQIGVESGLLAMILYIVTIIVAVILSIKRQTIWGYGILAFSIFSLFSCPIEKFQFQLLFAILLAMSSDGTCRENSSKSVYFFLLPIFFSMIFVLVNSRSWREQMDDRREWIDAGKWYDNEYYEFVISDYSQLFDGLKNNSQFLYEYGFSLNKMNYFDKSDSILMMGAKISSNPMFWNVMGNNSLAQGRYREAEERYKHAFYMVPNRLYPLTLLAKLYHTEGDTVSFLDMADKVDSFVPKIENNITEILRAEIREIREGYNIEAIKNEEQ